MWGRAVSAAATAPSTETIGDGTASTEDGKQERSQIVVVHDEDSVVAATNDDYSARSALTGTTRVARRAGR